MRTSIKSNKKKKKNLPKKEAAVINAALVWFRSGGLMGERQLWEAIKAIDSKHD